ncbi:hypothetical protein TIFTF001_000032 [Ficus carica]|uniref:Large ribosomal subunit protein bL17c n=1 Tax=Ficus carica TaxID=3494 RepID=A0AA87ZBN4_FICCA|nr:hypothetical protein TIFTF001_000032 [Ficus carica]
MGFCANAIVPSSSSGSVWNMASLKSALPSVSSSLRVPVTSAAFQSFSPTGLRSSRPRPRPKVALRYFSETNSFENCFTIIDNGGRISAMRHGRRVPKLNRPPDQRRALLRGLTTQLLKYGRIKTTRARASAMRKYVDKMITLAKDGSLHKRRQALGFIYEKQIVHALFAEVPERYGERNGGYTRIIRTLPRRGDNAPMAYIELV